MALNYCLVFCQARALRKGSCCEALWSLNQFRLAEIVVFISTSHLGILKCPPAEREAPGHHTRKLRSVKIHFANITSFKTTFSLFFFPGFWVSWKCHHQKNQRTKTKRQKQKKKTTHNYQQNPHKTNQKHHHHKEANLSKRLYTPLMRLIGF